MDLATKGGTESEEGLDGPHADGKSCGTQVERKDGWRGKGRRVTRGDSGVGGGGGVVDSKSAFHLSSPLVARGTFEATY